jgi:hypothetical protein
MGLDVYLYRYEDFASGEQLEAEYDKQTEPLWADNSLSREDRQAAIDRIGTALCMVKGKCDNWGCNKTQIEEPSKKYPDHYFKIGYLRSSYNDGGINRVLRKYGLPDLYDVFQPQDRYSFVPDWTECKQRIMSLREAYAEKMAGTGGKFDCLFVGLSIFARPSELPKSQAEALTAALPSLTRKELPFGGGSYSNGTGEYFPSGIRIVAAIPGVGVLKEPGVYLVFERQRSEDDDWYAQALEITEEMIDYVLASGELEKHALHWSS